MKCPHCDYTYGWNPVLMKDIDGGSGAFWRIAGHNAERGEYERVRTIFACPKCGVCFIET